MVVELKAVGLILREQELKGSVSFLLLQSNQYGVEERVRE